jgi:dCMP deaminase
MPRLTHDEYFIAMLKLVSARSTCARRSVGALIVDEGNRLLSTGYNGVPAGFVHCSMIPCDGANDAPGDTSRCLAIHAEVNAILQCAFNLPRAHKLYVTCAPCFQCAKLITNTSIQEVIALEPYSDSRGAQIFEQAGINFRVVNP